jgi:hypothetical protein
MTVKLTLGGSTKKTQSFFKEMKSKKKYAGLDDLAQRGVSALQSATPKDTSLTANSWTYEITSSGDKTVISWINTNNNNGVNIAIILQYGHGTGSGGYVAGRDYINPAIKPIMDEIADNVWKRVTIG